MQILDDFMKLNKLDGDKLNSFINHLNENQLMIPSDVVKFETWCTENSLNIEDGKSIYKFISFAANFVSEKGSISNGLNQFKQLLFGSMVIPAEFNSLWEKLETIVQHLTNFLLKIKEKRLVHQARRIGQFSLTCDIRPVFDLERKNIQRYLYPILLTLKEAGKNEIISFELTEDELNDMLSEIQNAFSKLKLLKNKISRS